MNSKITSEPAPTKWWGEEIGNISISAGNPFRSRQMIFRSVWASIKCPVQSRVLCLSGQPLLLPFAKWAPLNVQLDSAIPHRKPFEQRQHSGEEGHDGFILFLPATHTAHTSITGPSAWRPGSTLDVICHWSLGIDMLLKSTANLPLWHRWVLMKMICYVSERWLVVAVKIDLAN